MGPEKLATGEVGSVGELIRMHTRLDEYVELRVCEKSRTSIMSEQPCT